MNAVRFKFFGSSDNDHVDLHFESLMSSELDPALTLAGLLAVADKRCAA
jgi:hypothetical protein